MKRTVLAGVFALLSRGVACLYGDQHCQYDPKLAIQVQTPSGPVTIKGPLVTVGDNADLELLWRLKGVLRSPNRRFTAVYYYGDLSKVWSAEIYLVHPDGRIIKLPEASVFQVFWIPDSKYLIGVGKNTLRLWNLNGNVREAAFDNIRAMSVKGNRICINIQWNGWMQELQLAIPSLQRVSDRDTGGQPTCPPDNP